MYLKVDAQGWDLEVVEGARGCLDRIAALQVEVAVKQLYDDNPTYVEALPYLERLGFELVGAYPVERDNLMRVIELDCVMVRTARARVDSVRAA